MKILPLISLLLLTACGFTPVYGTASTPVTAESTLEKIEIGNIPDYNGQYLRNALIDRFYRNGTPSNALYTLSITPITERKRDLDITIDSDTTRAQITLSTKMTLKNNVTNTAVLNRNLRSTASYNILGSEYTNRVSEDAARHNLLNDLARQIELQASLFLKR